MAYIRRNVNLFLLLLVIVVLGVMAGLTTYYQVTYKNLSLSYGDKLNQLNKLNYNLSQQKAQLGNVNEELKLKTKAKEQFDTLYTNISDYNEKLADELARTRSELIDTLTKLKAAEADLSSTKSELSTSESALKTQQQYAAELEARVSSLRAEVCALRQRLNEAC
ncbi:hypothetical protein HYV82_01065 [Candidatus Woesearchaeota archaeon]|nr:hypothetical protein [Candidatus Woesearchaeota archaeon]